MDFPESRLIEERRAATAQLASASPVLPWSGRVQRSKLRRPELPADTLPRARLMARIDDGACPLTLIVAPAGFGKTTVAAEWAHQEPRAVWLTTDARDASLPRFWAHLRAALDEVEPGFGDLVTASLDAPLRASAVDLGRLLADELLDVARPVRLVLDDFHLVAASETHAFLSGLLDIAPPRFQALVTARSASPLPLARLRLRGAMRELHGADLLFTEEETQALVAHASTQSDDAAIDRHAALCWQQTRGWAAGVRLAAIAMEGGAEATATADTGVMVESLLDETLAGRPRSEHWALLCAAMPDAFVPALVTALTESDEASAAAPEAIRFARAADLCRPSPRFGDDWLEFHAIFREGLRQRLERDAPPATLRALHTRAATWFATSGRPDAAIGHWLAAGELETAIALVTREIQPAFDREDWPAIARWLALLPDDTVREHVPLALARGWIAHLRGQVRQLKEAMRAIEERLARGDLPPGELEMARAEMDLMVLGTYVPLQIDPERALQTAQSVLDRIPPTRRFQYGNAWTFFGLAMQANGRGDEAVARFAWWEESTPDRLDAGSIRGRFGLMFVHWQAANLARVQSMARSAVELSTRDHLRLTTGWSRYVLGNVLYERGDLDGAIAQYTALARDYAYLHLVVVRESFFGLALAYVAAGRTADGWRALRRSREILLDAGTLEHLPVLDAYEAYLALRTGDLPRALEWVRATVVGVDSGSLYFLVHPAMIHGAILCAAGDDGSLQEAVALLTGLRQLAARAHFLGALVRIDALLAIAHIARGEASAGVVAMHRSLATGAPRGYIRAYLDLLPTFAAELGRLATLMDVPAALRDALEAPPGATLPRSLPPHGQLEVEPLTLRERDVLAALCQRLSYREAGEQLFISPATVKRHASSIYSKLGVTGRSEAIVMARKLGWCS